MSETRADGMKRFWVIAVSPGGYADPEAGPVGPLTLEEAMKRADPKPDPLSGWRRLILEEYTPRDDRSTETAIAKVRCYGCGEMFELQASEWFCSDACHDAYPEEWPKVRY